MKNFKIAFIMPFFGMLFACAGLKPSEVERKGIDEVLSVYPGVINSSKSSKSSTGEGKKTVFELQLSKSELLEKYVDRSPMVASGMAYLFYKTAKGNDEYTHIKSILLFNDGKKEEYVFDAGELEIVIRKMEVVQNIAQLIIEQKLDDIRLVLNDSSYYKYDKEEIVSSLKKVEPTFSKPFEFMPLGFSFYKLDSGKELLHLSGILLRDQESTELSINVDPLSSDSEVLYLDYKL